MGSVEAYRRLKESRPREVTRVALYALEGALMGAHWNELPPEIKTEIVRAADA